MGVGGVRCPACGAELDLRLVLACPVATPATAQGEAAEIAEIVASMRPAIGAATRKPGQSEMVRHVMDHLGFRIDGTLTILRQLEGAEGSAIDRESVRLGLKNGRRRHLKCRFCPD